MAPLPQKADLVSVLRGQIARDPGLPPANPTASLWQTPPHPDVSNLRSSTLPRQVDFAIIGSGVAACGVAKSLLSNARSGTRSVAVFEARTLCSGATGRNGGQLTRLPPTRHTLMREAFGVAESKKVMLFTVRGLDEMHRLAESEGPGLEAFSTRTRLEKFFAYYDEAAWLETLDAIKLYDAEVPEDAGAYQTVTKEDAEKIYNVKGVYGGVKLAAGTCSPYNLVTGVFEILLNKYPARLTIETGTPVTKIVHRDDDARYPYLLQTSRGAVRAAHVVHCTNGHTAHLVPGLRGKVYPRRATMSVQSPGPKFPEMRQRQSWSFYFAPSLDRETGVIETGRYYGQQRADGDLWVGGDQNTVVGLVSADDTKIDGASSANIPTLLPRLFSDAWVVPRPDLRGMWSGIMGYTGDGLPLVGGLPVSATGRQGQGEWIAAGWNTYGMTNGLLCGYVLGAMMLGEAPPAYFPQSYLVTDQRLGGPQFSLDAVTSDFFTRIGAKEYVQERSAKL